MEGVKFKEESYKIIGACMEVHHELGCGFLESVYQEALEKEFLLQKIPFSREKGLDLRYKGEILSKKFYADFVCFDKIILELKAVENLIPEHEAQILNYLYATKLELGILINFGERKLTYKRFVL